MPEAPMNRDQQIRFMKEAAKRREERVARWSKDEMIKQVLREPAERPNGTEAYVRSDMHGKKCA
jgi:hypothetical protein